MKPSRSVGCLVAVIVAALAGCGGGDDTVFVADSVPAPTSPVDSPATASSATTVPATEPSLPEVFVERAWSPANAIAQIEGTGATAADPVTVDEQPGAVESFEGDVDGFVLRVRIEDEGAHTVCVRDTCSRVYTLAPDADTPEEIDAKIDEAVVRAAELFDGASRFPEWSIVRGGAFGSTGGTTDSGSQTITVYRNRGRSVEEFTVTILHEWGHVVDTELLDDAARADYLGLRGFDPATPWDALATHRIEDWAASPSEDFAEVMVVVWTGGEHQVRTTAPNGQPSAEELAATLALTGL